MKPAPTHPCTIEVDPKSGAVTKINPIVSATSKERIPENKWDHGLFHCFTGSWCLGIFCPNVLFGLVNHRYHHPEDPELLDYSQWCSSACWAYTCIGNAVPGFPAADCLAMFQRQSIRRTLNLRGNGCTDCLSQWFCTPCSLVQQEEQLKSDRARAKLLAMQHRVIEVRQPYQEQQMVYEKRPQFTYQQQPEAINQQSQAIYPQQSQEADLQLHNE